MSRIVPAFGVVLVLAAGFVLFHKTGDSNQPDAKSTANLQGLEFPSSFTINVEDIDQTQVKGSFKITNPSKSSIDISQVEKSCSCSKLTTKIPLTIGPGESVKFEFQVSLPRTRVSQGVNFNFFSNGESLTVQGGVFRESYIWAAPTAIDFGSHLPGAVVSRKFKISRSQDLEGKVLLEAEHEAISCRHTEDETYEVMIDTSKLPEGRHASVVNINCPGIESPRQIFIRGQILAIYDHIKAQIKSPDGKSDLIKVVVFRNDKKPIAMPKIEFGKEANVSLVKKESGVDDQRLTLIFRVEESKHRAFASLLFESDDLIEIDLSSF